MFPREPRRVSWNGYIQVDSNRYPVPLALAGQQLWIERLCGRGLQLLNANLKPVARFDLLREKGVTLPHPEHALRTQEYLDKKRQRRTQAKVTFEAQFPQVAAAFVPLAERGYRENGVRFGNCQHFALFYWASIGVGLASPVWVWIKPDLPAEVGKSAVGIRLQAWAPLLIGRFRQSRRQISGDRPR